MNWADAAAWLSKEINGYNGDSLVPAHRYVTAYKEWRPYGMHDMATKVVEEFYHGIADKQPTPWQIRAGLDDLVRYAEKGVIVHSEPDEKRWSGTDKRDVNGRVVTVVEADQAQSCLRGLGNALFEWASRAYSAMILGDAATEIWQQHRARVDAFLANQNLVGHVGAITGGLASAETQRWREAMWSTRDLLHDVAEHLWKDARKTYKHILDDDGKSIEVTADKFVNRLVAYMHQKGVTSTVGAELRAEWARLRGLNSLASSAHDKDAVTLEDAKLTFFATYMLLGELIQRTDCEPVETYK